MTVVTMWLPFSRYISAAPFRARLIDSVPPEVKTISFGSRAPSKRASSVRARSTAASASHPKGWLRLAGCPNFSVKYGSIASTTRGSAGVVDCASMKIGNFNAIVPPLPLTLTARGRQLLFDLDGPWPSIGSPDREQVRDVRAHQLGQAHRVEHLWDRRLDLLHRPPQVAARHLLTVARGLEAAHDVDRAFEGPDHVAHREVRRAPRQHVAALGPGGARDELLLREPLQDLREQLRRDVELVGDALGAHRTEILVDRDVVDGHQSVVRTLGETQHRRPVYS